MKKLTEDKKLSDFHTDTIKRFKVTRTWYVDADSTTDAIVKSKTWHHNKVDVQRVG
ncbi:unnamed protein product, partial [marine sediment metagenome]